MKEEINVHTKEQMSEFNKLYSPTKRTNFKAGLSDSVV